MSIASAAAGLLPSTRKLEMIVGAAIRMPYRLGGYAMIMPLMATLIVTGAADRGGDEIVVTARAGKCVAEMAKRQLSAGELSRLEKVWATGTAVRVIKPKGADDRCMTKIMFELARKGVTRVEFVNQSDDR